MTEWVFLFAILTGAFDPDSGWQKVERGRLAYATLALCETGRQAMYQKHRKDPIPGGGVVITGCQPEHKP